MRHLPENDDKVAAWGAALEREYGLEWTALRPAIGEALRQAPVGSGTAQPAGAVEALPRLLGRMLLGHTRFHRHDRVWEWMRENLRAAVPGPRVSALAAGCSTGEEAWTLAMLLADLYGRENIRVVGVDAVAQAVELAVQGVYRESDAARLPRAWRDAYFSRPETAAQTGSSGAARAAGTVGVDEPLRARVSFTVANLLRGVPGGPYDLVFLRNVLTYMTPAAAQTVLGNVAAAMTETGLLVVAPQETQSAAAAGWIPCTDSGLPVLRKAAPARGCVVQPPMLAAHHPEREQPALSAAKGGASDAPPRPWLALQARLEALLRDPPASVDLDLSSVREADYHVRRSIRAAVRLLRGAGCEVRIR